MVVATCEHWYFLPSALVDQIEPATYFYPAVQQANRRSRARIIQRSCMAAQAAVALLFAPLPLRSRSASLARAWKIQHCCAANRPSALEAQDARELRGFTDASQHYLRVGDARRGLGRGSSTQAPASSHSSDVWRASPWWLGPKPQQRDNSA